jgi:GT2 family glycosyltransferase
MSKIDISIIIATRNREKLLSKTIEKACLAIENTNAEIIVINDSDSPLSFRNQFSKRFLCLDNPKKGVSSARNLGASNAKGSILFFLDDDMWINKEVIDWINLFLLKNKNTDAVYNINWHYPDTLNDKLKNAKIGKYILSSNYNTMWGRMKEKGNEPENGLYSFDAVSSCSLVMSKETFNKVGKYNERTVFQGEDTELGNKLNTLAIKIYCVFDVTLYHNHEDRLQVHNYLKRLSDGYSSEFIAVKLGFINSPCVRYLDKSKIIFDFFRITEKIWIRFLQLLPNFFFLTPLNNKLIGMLGGLQRYKQWRIIIHQSCKK